MDEYYNPTEIEKKIQLTWLKNNTFVAPDSSNKPKYYCLSMFAYPSGKLHMGHVRNYTIGDVLSRFYKFNGYNVMQPFGWDAFGLPAENAAMQNNISPSSWTYQNIEYMKSQLQSLGLAIDWSREFSTCSSEYYKHQQWLFLQLYKKGLIYKKTAIVNWDPIDNTVLANEQVVDGKGWRSGADVIKKHIPMYYLKITAYADELLESLNSLDGWPEKVKIMQQNWIGKSSGVEITFKAKNSDFAIQVFTTRADTIMGVTYIAISNEHQFAKHAIQLNPALKKATEEYHKGGVSEAEFATQEKQGVFSGLYVLHPITLEEIPVWIANYVLTNYGTGAIMGVPAHCQRDFEFATKYTLPIKIVVVNKHSPTIDEPLNKAISENITEDNILINSQNFSGLNSSDAINKITQYLISHNQGTQKTNYRLRDWGISRQRYWGCPIPIIHCNNCGDIPVPFEQLPVILPENLIPNGGSSPLINDDTFIHTTCPECMGDAKRETDTMDTFVDSSWYYARFASYNCKDKILDERANYWLSVDQYIGGIEHAILHLLYARFIHKTLRDLNLVNTDEPFTNLLTQGMVLAETFFTQNQSGQKTWFNIADIKYSKDSSGKIIEAISKTNNQIVNYGGMEKMSKSKNNGVDPQFIIKNYGADTARLFMMFAAPPELALEWSEHGLEGANRFIRRLWRIVFEHKKNGITKKYTTGTLSNEHQKLRVQLHATINKVTMDIKDKKQFNTAIASIMELLNYYLKLSFFEQHAQELAQEVLESVIIMLSPIIPHVCEILWLELCPNTDINQQSWPKAEIKILHESVCEIIIQVNGKLRGKLIVDKGLTNQELEKLALTHENVIKFITDKTIKKIIIIPNKIVNIVI